jgi:hypothetical protein
MRSQDENVSSPAPLRAGADSASVHDPSAQWARTLLAEAEPYEEVPGRRERVWTNLQSRRLDSLSRRRGPLRWRLAFAALVLTTSAAFASAAMVGWPAWLARAIGPASSVPTVETRSRIRSTTDRTMPPTVAPPNAEPPAPPAPAVVAAPSVGYPTPQPAHARRQAAANTAATEDTGPLLQAMRALRIEHNPVRARQLLTDYLGQHPRGFLAEEALVMLVEAAAAHHDSDASALVARYHRLYPEGAFRGQVERISAAYDKKP